MNREDKEYITLEEGLKQLREVASTNETYGRFKLRIKKGLQEKIFDEEIIEINEELYIYKDYLEKSILLFNNSIDKSIAVNEIRNVWLEDISKEKIKNGISSKVNTYNINLISYESTFLNKDDFNLIMTNIEDVKNKKCITAKDLIKKINNSFKGMKFGSTEKKVFKFIRENKLEQIDSLHLGNFFYGGPTVYPENTVNQVIFNLKTYIIEKKVKLLSITYEEYFNMDDEKFKRDFILLDRNTIQELGEYNSTTYGFRKISKTFSESDVRVIWIHKGDIYVSQKEYDEFIDFRKNYVDSTYFNKFGIKFKGRLAKNNNIHLKKFKQKYYIKKEDVDRYLNIHSFNVEFGNANSVYDKFKIRMKYFPNENERKFPHCKNYFYGFVKYVNSRVTTFQHVSKLYNLYNALLDNMKCDLFRDNDEINNKFFNKMLKILGTSINAKHMYLSFINYLIDVKNFKINRFVNKTESQAKEPYTQQQFIMLLIKLVDIVANKDNLKKLYRNWNLSSAVAYLFMHYCIAWRKTDLVKQLPTPNLKNINVNFDGEKFIKWLEDGNSISDDMAMEICKEIEERTERLKLKASKNKRELNCIISEYLSKEVAILLCINEANRQIYRDNPYLNYRKNQYVFNARYVEHKSLNDLLKENFNFSIEEVLGGKFDNIRMNKGFLTLIKEKAEELGLAYSYYYAQIARNHTPTKSGISETTKIYLQKDISKASIRAFATGTMGSVLFTLLQLLDKNFTSLSYIEQINQVQNLNMTPYTIEKNVKVIVNKISVIKDQIEQLFNDRIEREGILKELLYGQTSYGIEERTKCFLKISRKDELGIVRIKSRNYSEENGNVKWCPLNRKSCIGCDYMIALRYFIYTLEKKFSKVLDDLEYAESELDKEIAIDSINELYLPILYDLQIVLESDISKVIDTKRYLRLANRN